METQENTRDQLRVTERGLAQIASLSRQSEEAGQGARALRVIIEGGGCSGFRYEFALVPPADKKDSDLLIEDATGSVRVFVDKASLPLLNGATLDYTHELIGDRFVVENPNATASCGCGVSFST